MRTTLSGLAFALATGLPLAALAQAVPPNPPPPRMAPPPEVRAQFDAARAAAKTAAFNALTAEHRTAVQAIVDQLGAGTMTDVRAAAQQIDALLTPAETAAVLAQAQTMHQAMHAAMLSRPDAPAAAKRPDGTGTSPAPDGAPHDGAPHDGTFKAHADAGRFLLMLSLDREKMRALHAQQKPAGAQ